MSPLWRDRFVEVRMRKFKLITAQAYHALHALVHKLVVQGRLQLTGDEAQWFYTEQPPELWKGREHHLGCPARTSGECCCRDW